MAREDGAAITELSSRTEAVDFVGAPFDNRTVSLHERVPKAIAMERERASALPRRGGPEMVRRSSSAEIPTLVRRLGSRNPTHVDTARARLAIVGARAVEALVETLEEDNHRIRGHAMQLLALIRDPRGREPLMAMLLDRDARMREIAARCLARFPSPDAAASLERLLKRERHGDVRLAAVQSILEQYQAGQDAAVRAVVEVLLDSSEDQRLRAAALALVPLLRGSERRGILRRLKQDPSEELRRRATELEEAGETQPSRGGRTIQALLETLAADDYAAWNEAVHRLAALGLPVVSPLLEEMQRRAHDPEYCTRAGMALKALGPRRVRVLAEALDRIREPLPLQVLVEVIGALGEKSLIYRLKDLIDRLALEDRATSESNGFDPLQRVRAKAHLELARVGSRVAIEDLRRALIDPDHRLELEMLAAVGMIGKREEIPDLLRAYAREDRFVRERIGGAVRAIMRRERIRRNSAMFQGLGAEQRRGLEAVLRAPATRVG